MKTLTKRSNLMLAVLITGTSLIPVSLSAVQARRILPHQEEEAAFCLQLLSRGGSEVSYLDGRAIQILGEGIAYTSEASAPSLMGRAAAETFLSESPTDELVSRRLMECRVNLERITEGYTLHSCGYEMGSLSKDWSARDWEYYQELLRGDQRNVEMITLSR